MSLTQGHSGDLFRFSRSLDPADIRHVAGLSGGKQIQQTRLALDSCGATELLASEGIVVVTGLVELEPQQWPDMFLQICQAWGPLLPQSASDPTQVVREVRYRATDLGSRTTRYSDSRSGGSYHTDGVPVPGSLPDLLALLCVRPAAAGGELVFIDSARVLALACARMPALVDILSVPFHFDQRRADEPGATVARCIVETAADGAPERLVYLREYVESGHANNRVRPLTPNEIEAMDVIDAVLDDESLHLEGVLAPGQIAVSDNRRYLHGRHHFSDPPDGGDPRLMLRCWIGQP